MSGGPFDFVSGLPPVLQLGLVGFLGGFTALSVAGRLWPRLGRRIFDPERDPGSFEHLAGYTLVPLLLFAAALFTVFTQWQPDRPLLDGMSPAVWRAVAGAALSLGLVITAQILRRRMDLSDARKLSAWLPLLLLLGGFALMVVSIERLHRFLH